MTDRDSAGRFLPGNRIWEARSSYGRRPIFASADELWAACVEYFEWVDDTPLHEAKAFAYEGHVTVEALPKMRAMTIGGLCLFLDVTRETWGQWRKPGSVYSEVATRAEEIIRDQKFGGAAAGLLNPNIIARDLGLADKSEITGKDGGPIETAATLNVAKLSDAALAEIIAASEPDDA
ncbi:MAG: DNA-packaging protein [Pseudomonadota bacterium]|nr:DNA-packaging protein [Pseudomonadota bacterium]